jgi:hypothetical protein
VLVLYQFGLDPRDEGFAPRVAASGLKLREQLWEKLESRVPHQESTLELDGRARCAITRALHSWLYIVDAQWKDPCFAARPTSRKASGCAAPDRKEPLGRIQEGVVLCSYFEALARSGFEVEGPVPRTISPSGSPSKNHRSSGLQQRRPTAVVSLTFSKANATAAADGVKTEGKPRTIVSTTRQRLAATDPCPADSAEVRQDRVPRGGHLIHVHKNKEKTTSCSAYSGRFIVVIGRLVLSQKVDHATGKDPGSESIVTTIPIRASLGFLYRHLLLADSCRLSGI